LETTRLNVPDPIVPKERIQGFSGDENLTESGTFNQTVFVILDSICPAGKQV
jgi:hypothetical protein